MQHAFKMIHLLTQRPYKQNANITWKIFPPVPRQPKLQHGYAVTLCKGNLCPLLFLFFFRALHLKKVIVHAETTLTSKISSAQNLADFLLLSKKI